MDIDDYQITKYYTSAGYYYMMKQLFHICIYKDINIQLIQTKLFFPECDLLFCNINNPYFPIFDFTLTNTKTNLSAKKKFN